MSTLSVCPDLHMNDGELYGASTRCHVVYTILSKTREWLLSRVNNEERVSNAP